MGSQFIQGQLWGKRAKDWANIQEQTGMAGYQYVLNMLQPLHGVTLLDIGCGSGLFSNLATASGAEVTGIDASAPLLEEAKQRTSTATFLIGEMEELPFGENTFDIVCGFNSFQFAADSKHALAEAWRVLKPNGKLAVMIWGNKEDCEATAFLKAISGLLPPPPPGTPGPFALTENHQLEKLAEAVGFTLLSSADIDIVWEYPDTDTALKGLLSAGPSARAIEMVGFEKVYTAANESLQPFIHDNGRVVYKNKFRILMAEK